jgi:hypothetical protein
MRVAAFIVGSLTTMAVHADPMVVPAGDPNARIRQWKDEASALRSQAEDAYKSRQAECAKRLIKIDDACLDHAREAKKDALVKARELEDRAADLEPIDDAERAAVKARIAQLKERAAFVRSAAEQSFKDTQAQCAKKFLVNDCIEDATEVRLAAQEEARDLEQLARDVERQLRKRELATRADRQRQKELRQAADNPRPDAR